MAPSAPARPRSVTLTIGGVFLWGLSNLWLAFGLWQQRGLLVARGVSFDPGVRLVLALIWAAAFLVLAVGAGRRMSVTRLLIPGGLLLFAIYDVGALLLLGQATYARQGLPLLAVLYGAAVLFAGWGLNRPVARRYFDA